MTVYIPMDTVMLAAILIVAAALVVLDCRNLEVRTRNNIRREREKAERAGMKYD